MKIAEVLKNAVLTACAVVILTAGYAQEKDALSDAEVAFVAVTANQIDIDNAKLAKQRSENAEVLKFAETMANDHQAVIEQASALASKLGVTPKENAVSSGLLADAAATRKVLALKSGIEFDRAYINNEVTYHQNVISAIKDLLIPEAENKELKALLNDVLPAFDAHLEHAQMVQKQIASK